MQASIDAALYQRDRTREGDREAVLQVLREWDATGIVLEDLVDEVEYLSRWDVGEILKEVGHLLEYRDEYRPADAWSGAPRQIIRLRRVAAAGWRDAGVPCGGAAAEGRGGEVPAHG